MHRETIKKNRIVFGFEPFRARCPMFCTKRSPVPLVKFQMAPTPSILMSSGSKTKEPRYICLSEAKALHSPKICTEVSSSVPHFQQVGLFLSPITLRCLLIFVTSGFLPVSRIDIELLRKL